MNSRRSARSLVVAVAGVLLAFSLSAGAYAEAVIQTVTVKVAPGKLGAYVAKVGELQGVMDRLGGGGKVVVWQAVAAGTATGNTMVAVSYPSLTAYAETTSKSTADPEWQKILASLGDIRTTLNTSLIEARDGGGMPADAAAGSILQGVIVQVKPGQLDAYLAKIKTLQAIQKRLGSSATMRVWQSIVGGQATGSVAVALVHPSLVAYAENTTKTNNDPEAQQVLGSLDSIRTMVSTSLYQAQ